MKSQSAKGKGRKGQQEIRDLILSVFSDLVPDDVRSTSMGAQGEDLLLSPKARECLPFSIEVKRRAKIAALRYMDQAKGHGPYKPLCFLREDHDQWYAIIRARDLLDILKGLNILEGK